MTVNSKLAVLTALIRNLERYLSDIQDHVISVDISRRWHAGQVRYYARVHWYGDPVVLHDLVGGGPVSLEWRPCGSWSYYWEFDALGIRWLGHCDEGAAERLRDKGEAPAAATAEAR